MVRFDQPCLKVGGAVEYFREHMTGDYLTQGGTVAMTWHGQSAERLGLPERCDLHDFQSLCHGLHPHTQERLTPRDKGARRRVCFFAQLSAPKDVSIAYLVVGDNRIAVWWQEAVLETFDEIEAATATRVRKNGANTDRVTGECVAAMVTHDTNRALDPQLHTHLCIMNLTFDPVEDRWKGVQPAAYYRRQSYFREVCYNKLAQRMTAAGYDIEPVRNLGFRLRGFPADLRERFSKRRRQILKEAAAVGQSSQDALQTITAQTRADKSHATAADLRQRWIEEAGAELEPVRNAVRAATGSPVATERPDPPATLASAEAHLFERRSVCDEHRLISEALIASGYRLDLAEAKAAIAQRVASGALLKQGEFITSRETLAAEEEFVAWAVRGRASFLPLGAPVAADGLESDQHAAVSAILDSRSQVVILQGDAGTGKTRSLQAVLKGIEALGDRAFGCAPSSGATDVLRRELTADADTLQQLLVNPSLQHSLTGRTIIVDEAGLISVREMRDLCRLAETHRYRLLLVGDTKQHHSVEAGDALRCLQRYAQVPTIRLTTIRRQRDPRYRAAVAALARGEAHRALNAFARFGAVSEIPDRRQLFALAAEDYIQTRKAGKTCLVISPVWSEIHAFAGEVRAKLKAAGLLGTEERTLETIYSLKWTREETRRIQNYQPGQLLVFHRDFRGLVRHEIAPVIERKDHRIRIRRADGEERLIDPRNCSAYDVAIRRDTSVAPGEILLIRANLPEHSLRNGDLVEVSGFDADGSLNLTDGRTIPAGFREFSHGYATTSHASQGKTVDRGILLMADQGIAAGNLKQAYVSNSRFRESQMIYTTDLDAARQAMQRPGERMLASEAVPEAAERARKRRSYFARLNWRKRQAAIVPTPSAA